LQGNRLSSIRHPSLSRLPRCRRLCVGLQRTSDGVRAGQRPEIHRGESQAQRPLRPDRAHLRVFFIRQTFF
jgi:hypothetical protein